MFLWQAKPVFPNMAVETSPRAARTAWETTPFPHPAQLLPCRNCCPHTCPPSLSRGIPPGGMARWAASHLALLLLSPLTERSPRPSSGSCLARVLPHRRPRCAPAGGFPPTSRLRKPSPAPPSPLPPSLPPGSLPPEAGESGQGRRPGARQGLLLRGWQWTEQRNPGRNPLRQKLRSGCSRTVLRGGWETQAGFLKEEASAPALEE